MKDLCQSSFDLVIGQLDRCLSVMVLESRSESNQDLPNRQTLKHHAEDMIAAGNKILKNLGLDSSGDIYTS